MELEVWKSIEGYTGLYEISNRGRVCALQKCKRGKHGSVHTTKTKVLKGYVNKMGYQKVILTKDGERKDFLIHRLVAMAFIPNPFNFPYINHKDENKINNVANNLEWCDTNYNLNYGTRNQRISNSKYRPVVLIDKDGREMIFTSTKEASGYLNTTNDTIYNAIYRQSKLKGFIIKRK